MHSSKIETITEFAESFTQLVTTILNETLSFSCQHCVKISMCYENNPPFSCLNSTIRKITIKQVPGLGFAMLWGTFLKSSMSMMPFISLSLSAY